MAKPKFYGALYSTEEHNFGEVLSVFEDNGISIEHMPSGIDTMTVFVHQDEFVEKEQKVLAQIHKAVNPDSVELEANLALIAVVGRGMKNSTGIAGNIFSALAKAKINVKMIDQGSSELNIIRQFLKDNSIECIGEFNNTLIDLSKELPVFNSEDE